MDKPIKESIGEVIKLANDSLFGLSIRFWIKDLLKQIKCQEE
jgi:acyl-CoA reductase-like NAD-dependent aldehyde dehydrogenase